MHLIGTLIHILGNILKSSDDLHPRVYLSLIMWKELIYSIMYICLLKQVKKFHITASYACWISLIATSIYIILDCNNFLSLCCKLTKLCIREVSTANCIYVILGVMGCMVA